MKRTADQLVALQFLAVVLPIAIVLLGQLVIDSHRAAALEHSRPLRILADDARADYKTFTNGAADAVDTGTLGGQSVEALHSAALRLGQLTHTADEPSVREAAAVVQRLAADIRTGTTLSTLLPMRDRVMLGDKLTRDLDEQFQRRDELVVKDAIDSAALQRRAVIVALFITAILTIRFVLATRRRLKARLEEDIAVERRRRAELETISVRFGIATQAARAGVYEVRRDGADVWWSETMYELYQQSPQSFQPNRAAWLELIHPDDRDSAQEAMTAAMSGQRALRAQYRIVRADKTVCHIASLAAVAADPIDGGTRLVGIDLDITERVEAEERERNLQAQLRDASRQAGMAEIATNVLHNVGNALNSVNVSASLVSDSVKKSRAAGLGRIVDLLRAHEGDLGQFVSSDERGRHLPAYLAQLSEHLRGEQQEMLQEIENLRGNIDHIKEIVAMQQSYAKRCGVPERQSVASLVEDALRINEGSFTRNGIELSCEFDKVPDIVVEKHRVVQILINLLRNAKHACEASERPDPQIRVRVTNSDGGVQIAVSDNGVGIGPEHMSQLFRHGFTTKRDGHGFGLHSGALAAREMGGALRAHSAGPGCGATFTLELPVNDVEAKHVA